MNGTAPTGRTGRARGPLARIGLLAALLLAGGCSGTSVVPDTFDIMPGRVNNGMGRAFHAAVWMPDQQNLMLVGGQDRDGIALSGSRFAERIACATCSFIPEGALDPGVGRVNPALAATATGVLIAGGQASGVESANPGPPPAVLPVSSAVTDALHYRAVSAFADTVALPAGAAGAALGTLNGTPYLSGGRDTTGNVSAAIRAFDGASFLHNWDMVREREGHTVTPLADGSLLIVGGFGLGGFALRSAELFDPAGGAAELPGIDGPWEDRALHTATASADGCQVLIYGGVNSGGLVAGPELFTSAGAGCAGDGRFHVVPLAGPADRRVHHGAARLDNGDVLIVGGVADDVGTVTGTARLFNFALQRLRDTAAPLSFPRFGHSASVMRDGSVLVAGGLDGVFVPVTEVERYVPTSF